MIAPYPSTRRVVHLSYRALLALFFLCFTLNPTRAQELSAPGALAPEDWSLKIKPSIETLAARGEAPLSRLYNYIKLDDSKVRRLPSLNQSELPNDDAMAKRVQVGLVRTFMLDTFSSSSFYKTAGGSVGIMGIITEGALMTRVHFSDVSLPPGAKIFVSSMKNPDEFYGPFEGTGSLGDGTFWTPPVEGDGVVIEYFIPDSPSGLKQGVSYFNISGVSHIYRDPQDAFKFDDPTKAAGACENNVTVDWTNVAKSVGRLQFTSGGGDFVCTGTLLNTTNSSFIPYLLTANHCFSTQAEAQTLRVYWNYNSAGPLPSPPNRTDGSNLLATSPSSGTTSDFTFVQLTGAVPGGLLFSGWDANTFTGSASGTGIHHPDGDYKRISFGTARQPTSQAECDSSGVTGLQCVAVDWSSGVTEGGSSGSGIWKGSPSDQGGPRLIGTLTGGPSSCSASSANRKDFYGRFSVTYPNISQYLNSGSPTPTPTPQAQANLTPFQPTGWSDKIVVSKTTGTSIDSAPLTTTDTLYIDWAVINNGDAATAATFFSKLYVDGVERQTWNTSPPLNANFYTYVQDYSIGSLSAGQHTIKIVSDTSGAIVEKNEADNEYSRTITVSATQATATVGLSLASYTINEADQTGVATITVNRTGNTSTAVSVDYTTSDTSALVPCQTNTNGIASDRCDYATAVGTLRFAAGETSKTIQIPIINDAYVEPAESFTITLRNPQGATLGTLTATVTITSDDAQTAAQNPIDNQAFFIGEQYIDFLGRIAEPVGFDFWNNRMNNCPAGQVCDRTDTSMRFFQSDEFQERGFYVYRLYDATLGKLPKYSEFVPDVARLNGPQTVTEQRLGKDAYLLDFMNKAEFKALYGQYLSANLLTAVDAAGFVNALCTKSGITPASRQTLINNLLSNAKDPAHTLEDFILTPEMSSVGTLYYDRGFIVMQYFGYLRRDPDSGGFTFWVGQLIGAGAPHRQDYRFMVGGFLQSDEYRFRFAAP